MQTGLPQMAREIKPSNVGFTKLNVKIERVEILRCFDSVYRRPYRHFSIAFKVIVYPCQIAMKFSQLTNFGEKFVKMSKIDITRVTVNRRL